MSINKLNYLIEKYNLTNVIKVIIILIILFLAYRVFSSSLEMQKHQPYMLLEGFETAVLGNANLYGNVLSLKNPQNIPTYSGNTCILTLNDTYRIDTLIINFNNNPNNNTTSGTPVSTRSGSTSTSALPTPPYTNNLSVNIKFQDANGNMQYINSSSLTNGSSPPNFASIVNMLTTNNSTNSLTLYNITDENGNTVYTSKIIIVIGDSTNKIDIYQDVNNNRYIANFGIYGGERDLPTVSDYNDSCNNLIITGPSPLATPTTLTNISALADVYNFKQIHNPYSATTDDLMIYAIKLGQLVVGNNNQTILTENPFNITITYQNSIYPQNIFTINTTYRVRSDLHRITTSTDTYIFFSQPIITNNITFTVQRAILSNIPNSNNIALNTNIALTIGTFTALCKVPNASEISDYKRTVNTINQSTSNSDSSANVCPSINELVDTQTKTQQICDNLEYQDKVKSEKIRLERNKQYLLKLKEQQEQVDQLNMVIQDLETKRAARAAVNDQARVLQYQNQKASASTIRDLANQRLESQANNQLYMDVKVN